MPGYYPLGIRTQLQPSVITLVSYSPSTKYVAANQYQRVWVLDKLQALDRVYDPRG